VNANHWAVACGLSGCLALGISCASDPQGFEFSNSAEVAVDNAPAALRGWHERDKIAWAGCPEDFLDECAWVPLPIDHDEPDGAALPIFVSRRLASSGHGDAQLWLLQGGPGGSANTFKDLIEQQLVPAMPNVDFYILEQRGVGESAALGCTLERACLQRDPPAARSERRGARTAGARAARTSPSGPAARRSTRRAVGTAEPLGSRRPDAAAARLTGNDAAERGHPVSCRSQLWPMPRKRIGRVETAGARWSTRRRTQAKGFT